MSRNFRVVPNESSSSRREREKDRKTEEESRGYIEEGSRVRRPRNVILRRTKSPAFGASSRGRGLAPRCRVVSRAEGVRSAARARAPLNKSEPPLHRARRVSVGSADGRVLPHDPSTEITRMKYAHLSGIPTRHGPVEAVGSLEREG